MQTDSAAEEQPLQHPRHNLLLHGETLPIWPSAVQPDRHEIIALRLTAHLVAVEVDGEEKVMLGRHGVSQSAE